MSKLIIRHGERVTEHRVDDHALVVGRDPQCDLFFADKKLSRRHARFELRGDAIRLIDLGSRNGCWVNEERVEDKVLTASDAVRLGGLSIRVETEQRAASRDDQESTVFLTAEPSADDSRTVVLPRQDLPDSEPPPETGTVVLSAQETMGVEADSTTELAPVDSLTQVGDEDPTLRKPDGDENAERTMMLEGGAPRQATDTGTVIFRGRTAEPVDPATSVVAPVPAAPAPAETRIQAPELPPLEDESVFPGGRQPWELEPAARVSPASSLRFAGLVAAVAALAFMVLAVPLMRTLGSSLAAESSLRGRVLVDLLAATNEEALRENRPEAIVIDRVAGEPGVVGAYILDPMGRVLAPRDTSSDASATLLQRLGVDVEAKDIRAFRRSQIGDHETVYTLPVRAQGRRLGIAVLHYRTGAALSSWTAVMLVLGSLLMLMGVAAAVLMARRWTLLPVQELRDDVEALRRGFVESVAEDRPYSDLATIARSFNELFHERGAPSAGAGPAEPPGDVSETFKPVVDPTLVPDDHEQAEG